MMAKPYSRQKIGDPAAYEEKLKRTRALFNSDMRVLEIGCGTGGTARLHAEHVKHVHAIDFSSKMIEIAKRRQNDEGVQNVSFEVATIDELSPNKPYDVLMAMSVLHLLPNWKRVLERIPQFIRPGGYFISSTVVLQSAPWYLRILLKLLRPIGLLPPLQMIPALQLKAEIERVGFEVLDFWQPKPESVFVIARLPE